jgi:hypothetical protein
MNNGFKMDGIATRATPEFNPSPTLNDMVVHNIHVKASHRHLMSDLRSVCIYVVGSWCHYNVTNGSSQK